MWKSIFGGKWTSRQNSSEQSINQPRHRSPTGAEAEDDGFVLLGQTAIERTTVGPSHHVNTSSSQFDPPSYDQIAHSRHNNYFSNRPRPYHISPNMGGRSSNLVSTEASPEYVSQPPVTHGTQDGNIENFTLLDSPAKNASHTNRNNRNDRPMTSTTVVSTLPGAIEDNDIDLQNTINFTPRTHTATVCDSQQSPTDGIPFKLAWWLKHTQTDWSKYDGLVIPNLDLKDFNYDFSLERNVVNEARANGLY